MDLGFISGLFSPIITYFVKKEERKRRRILEMTKLIVCPGIDILEKSIGNLKKHEYAIFSDTTGPTNIGKILQVYKYPRLKDEFYLQYPKIKEKAEDWLKEHDMLTTKLREIFRMILANQDFLAIVGEYPNKNYLPSYIIDNLDSLPDSCTCKEFWSINAPSLLKLREKDGIRNKLDELKEINIKLLAHSNEIFQEFERIRKSEKGKYDFTEEELKEPSDYSVPRGSNIL